MLGCVQPALIAAHIKGKALAAQAQNLIHALQGKSALLGRLAVIAVALTLVAGEAMAKNRPWAI